MGELEEKRERVTRHELRHDRHTVSLLFIKYPPKYSVSWIANRIKGRSSKMLRDRFPQLKEWCPGHLWAPSCYHGSVGHGWEVVEKYISGQKGYDKIEAARGEREREEK
ncbi:MAG: IS200/IS605 family transposase, partial [Methanosarcinales archaeon]